MFFHWNRQSYKTQEENKTRATHWALTVWNELRFPICHMEQNIVAEVWLITMRSVFKRKKKKINKFNIGHIRLFWVCKPSRAPKAVTALPVLSLHCGDITCGHLKSTELNQTRMPGPVKEGLWQFKVKDCAAKTTTCKHSITFCWYMWLMVHLMNKIWRPYKPNFLGIPYSYLAAPSMSQLLLTLQKEIYCPSHSD